jgi:hypothetical protein
MRHIWVLIALGLCSSGCSSRSDLLINVGVMSYQPGWVGGNTTVSATVHDRSTGDFLTDARVTVNGVVLTSSPDVGIYVGVVEVTPGAPVTVTVSARGRDHSASPSQFSVYPAISTPAPNIRWPSLCTRDVVWDPAAPITADALYQVSVQSLDDPDAGNLWLGVPILAGSADAGHAQVGPLVVSVETSAQVSVAVYRYPTIARADSEWSILVGGVSTVPVIVDPGSSSCSRVDPSR